MMHGAAGLGRRLRRAQRLQRRRHDRRVLRVGRPRDAARDRRAAAGAPDGGAGAAAHRRRAARALPRRRRPRAVLAHRAAADPRDHPARRQGVALVRRCLSCMDLVGGDSQQFAHWLALPELLHVGSLIIDDVQDDSDVRRGGPACHKMYGEPLAINAGCASYFLAQIPAVTSGLERLAAASASTRRTSRRCARRTPARRSTSTASRG